MRKNFKIIDAHCHIYPDKIAVKASRGLSDFYGGLPVRNTGTPSDLVAHGCASGADHFVVCSVATAPAQVPSINHYVAESVAASGGKFTGLGALHPDSADLDGDIQLIQELGLHGVKLHADFQQIAIDDPRCFKIYERIEGKLPLLTHTGDSRYRYSNPENLVPVLKTFKNLTVVGAHFGGWSVWQEAADKLDGFENFHVDTCSTFGFCDQEFIKGLISRYGENRVLFGADYPMWNIGDELDTLFSLNLPEKVLQKILSDNAVRVYGI